MMDGNTRFGNAKYAMLGCFLILFSLFSTYMLHIKVGLNHDKHAHVSQIMAADTAWAGKLLMEFAHEIDEDFERLVDGTEEEFFAGLETVNENDDASNVLLRESTTTLPSRVTTNGPLRVAPGIVWGLGERSCRAPYSNVELHTDASGSVSRPCWVHVAEVSTHWKTPAVS